jgi:hypothetical protein
MSDRILEAITDFEAKLSKSRADHQREHEAIDQRLFEVAQRSTARKDDGPAHRHTVGANFAAKFAENRELFGKTKSLRLEVKAATDVVSTSSGRMIESGGVGAPDGRVLGMQNGWTMIPTAATAIEYSRFTGTQGAAAVQATEGGLKAAIRPDHSLITQNALTVAGYAKLSRQSLNDSTELARAIDVTLRRSVNSALDAALVNGVAAFSGFETLASAYTGTFSQNLPDCISQAVAEMQVLGFQPDIVGISPIDWLAMVVRKGTSNDHYLSGDYLGPMPLEFRGMRVVLSPNVNTNRALVVDSAHTDLMMREDFAIEIGYENQDFTSNIATILGEMRVIPIFRTVGSMRLVAPAA